MSKYDSFLNLLANGWPDKGWSISYPNYDEIIIRSNHWGIGVKISKYIIENIKIQDIEEDINKYLKSIE